MKETTNVSISSLLNDEIPFIGCSKDPWDVYVITDNTTNTLQFYDTYITNPVTTEPFTLQLYNTYIIDPVTAGSFLTQYFTNQYNSRETFADSNSLQLRVKSDVEFIMHIINKRLNERPI